ncbi:MAG: stilbene synthase [Candidatus Kapabacteria bacterium]|jgi:alkylresorcinol/alkylpyrone synthase|nr:stilbene synthase [Candidatus Kapabacteria bacterium]
MRSAFLSGIKTALPKHKVSQTDVRDLVHALFERDYKGLHRLMPVFENTNIQARYFSKPLSWFSEQTTFVESSAAFVETAVELLQSASEQAIAATNTNPNEIGMVVVVSTTGITTPSLDGKLIQALGLSNSTKRIPVWGLGCAGGVAGLARASELVSILPKGKKLLFAAVELCSLTFQRNDISKSNIVASSLFADGAAALILENSGAEHSHFQIVDSYSFMFDDSEDIMGWDIIETGLKVRFSRDIPTLIHANLPQLLHDACQTWGIRREEIEHFVVHAGGTKVLQAYSDSLGISPEKLEIAHEILRHHGNMSSVSVLFALRDFLAQTKPTGTFGVMMALGPGFSAEFVLFRY